MTEETQGRQHALDGFDQRLGRGFRAIGIGLAQRQKIGQQLQNRNGIARNMPAIGQDLALQLIFSRLRRAARAVGGETGSARAAKANAMRARRRSSPSSMAAATVRR